MVKQFLFLFSFLIVSCVHLDEQNKATTEIFHIPRDIVWEVLVLVLKSYPLKVIDENNGYLETKTLKAGNFWKAPHQKTKNILGYRSVIRVKLNYRKPYSKVYIDKKIYEQKGFLSSEEEIPSDFLEEQVLLYRINRELSIRSRLNKFQ